MLQRLLTEFTYVAFFLALAAGGIGVPIPEDLVLLTAGALSHQGMVIWWLAAAVCYVGVLAGDTLLFLTARKLGTKALETRRFRKLLPPHRREKIERLYAKRGGLVVLAGRHMPGLRMPIFALAGIHGMRYVRFILWDALALCISLPIVFFLGYLFFDQLDKVKRRISGFEHILLLAAVVALVIWIIVSYFRNPESHFLRHVFRRRKKS
jgi:membrane protein DedA with SNARE-associated domain